MRGYVVVIGLAVGFAVGLLVGSSDASAQEQATLPTVCDSPPGGMEKRQAWFDALRAEGRTTFIVLPYGVQGSIGANICAW